MTPPRSGEEFTRKLPDFFSNNGCMVKNASHKRQDSGPQNSQKGIDPRLKALVTYLAEWAAEQDFEALRKQKKDADTNKG